MPGKPRVNRQDRYAPNAAGEWWYVYDRARLRNVGLPTERYRTREAARARAKALNLKV